MITTEREISEKTQKHICNYLTACDPLLMMSLLMEFGRVQRHDLTDEEYRQISACHNLIAALFRNE